MLNHKHLLIFLVSIFGSQAYAYDPQDGNITATFGEFLYKSNFSNTASGAKSSSRGNLAFLIGGDISDKGSLEISLFHMDKQYFREESGLSLIEQTQLMQIGMGYRRWFNPYFSSALSFYSAYPLDEASVVHSDFVPGTAITTSGRDQTEYGLDLSIQAEVWHNERFTVVADARYAFSLTNQPAEKGDHYGVLLGIKYLFQEKYPIRSQGKKAGAETDDSDDDSKEDLAPKK